MACIATPMALSIASLICLVVVFLGGTNSNDANLRSLYYFKVRTNMSEYIRTLGNTVPIR